MKIAYVTMQFPVPSETFASLDVNTLIQMGHDVSVFALRMPHKSHHKLMAQRAHRPEGVRHFRWQETLSVIWATISQPVQTLCLLGWLFRYCFTKPKHLFRALLLVPAVMWHFKTIRQDEFDVVHLFWGHYPSMLGYLVKKFLPGVQVTQFLGAHDLIVNFPGSAALARQLRHVFTHCQFNVAQIVSLGIEPENIDVIHRGIRVDDIADHLDKFTQLQAPTFMTAGRLIDAKGIDDVIAVFSKIVSHYPQAQLKIAGDGPSRAAFEQVVRQSGLSSSVQFLGHIEQSELFARMSTTHFFLLMSRYASERLPNVVKEAMLRQCVVVTTASPGIEELVIDGHSGFVVESSAVDAACDAIQHCLDSPQLARDVAEAASLEVRAKFDVKASMKKYLSIWQEQI